jgi:hypothetical protein
MSINGGGRAAATYPHHSAVGIMRLSDASSVAGTWRSAPNKLTNSAVEVLSNCQ